VPVRRLLERGGVAEQLGDTISMGAVLRLELAVSGLSWGGGAAFLRGGGGWLVGRGGGGSSWTTPGSVTITDGSRSPGLRGASAARIPAELTGRLWTGLGAGGSTSGGSTGSQQQLAWARKGHCLGAGQAQRREEWSRPSYALLDGSGKAWHRGSLYALVGAWLEVRRSRAAHPRRRTFMVVEKSGVGSATGSAGGGPLPVGTFIVLEKSGIGSGGGGRFR